MARPNGDPSELIRRLEAALDVAKPSDVVSAEEMAKILSITWRHFLAKHIEPDPKFPIQKRGAEGVAWEFRVTKVLRHMVKRAKERVAENEGRSRRIAELTGFSVPESETSGFGISEINKLIDANMRALSLKKEQGAYVPASEVRLFLTGYNRRARDTLLGIGKAIDPIGVLPPEVASLIEDKLRDLALELQGECDKFTGEWREAVGSGGVA